MNQVTKILNDIYDLRDLNKEEQIKIQELRQKINKHIGMIVVRSKKINILDNKLRKIIRGEEWNQLTSKEMTFQKAITLVI